MSRGICIYRSLTFQDVVVVVDVFKKTKTIKLLIGNVIFQTQPPMPPYPTFPQPGPNQIQFPQFQNPHFQQRNHFGFHGSQDRNIQSRGFQPGFPKHLPSVSGGVTLGPSWNKDHRNQFQPEADKVSFLENITKPSCISLVGIFFFFNNCDRVLHFVTDDPRNWLFDSANNKIYILKYVGYCR